MLVLLGNVLIVRERMTGRMPTIYLKDATFTKLVDSGHYHNYDEVIHRGVILALEEEARLKEEARQVPKSTPLPPASEPEKPHVSPSSTSTESENHALTGTPTRNLTPGEEAVNRRLRAALGR